MAESTLSLTRTDLVRAVARVVGYLKQYSTGTLAVTAGVTTLSVGTYPAFGFGVQVFGGTSYVVDTRNSTTQVTLKDLTATAASGTTHVLEFITEANLIDVALIVERGLRQFYFVGPRSELNGAPYEWRFLKPTMDFKIISGDRDILLPDDFGGIDGPVEFSTGDSAWGSVQVVDPTEIDSMRGLSTAGTVSSWPRYVAIRPLKHEQTDGQRKELAIWPEADGPYTLRIKFNVLPENLTAIREYPYGGAQHAETILASCESQAELYMDDERGVRWENYQERLAASVAIDSRSNRAEYLGYNSNVERPDMGQIAGKRFENYSLVTYAGNQYTGV